MAYQSNSGGGGSGGLKKPSIEIAGGKLEPAQLPFGAKGVKWTKQFAKGGKVKKMAAGGTAVPADLMNALSAQRALATPTSAPSIGRQASLVRRPPAMPAKNLPKNQTASRRLATNDAPEMTQSASAEKIKSPPPKVPENFSFVPKEPSVPGYPPKKNYLMKSGGKVSSASKRADGCAIKGKTRGKMV